MVANSTIQHFNNWYFLIQQINRIIILILLYIIIYNNIIVNLNIIVALCISPIVELLKCWKSNSVKDILKTRTTYRGDKWLLLKNKIFLNLYKWHLFTARPVPSRSAPPRRAWTCAVWVTRDDAGADCNPAIP